MKKIIVEIDGVNDEEENQLFWEIHDEIANRIRRTNSNNVRAEIKVIT